MKKQRSFLLLFVLLLLALLIVGFGSAAAQTDSAQSDAISLVLDAGYDTRYRAGDWTPLLLTVANDGPGFSGALRVRSENNAGITATTYTTPIDLPQQSRKQVFLNVVLAEFSRQIQVELVNEQGSVMATADSRLFTVATGDVLTAVVTDAPSGSVDLSGLSLGEGQSYQSNWSIDNIPTQATALQGLDVLLLADVDTGRLSVEQQAALANWVRAGGHLIVAGGPNYRLTTAGLPADLLPVTITGTTTLDDLTPVAAFTGASDETLREPDIIVTIGDVLPTAQTLVAVEGLPVVVRHTVGAGTVDYLAVDPGLAPLRGWSDLTGLWEALIFGTRQMPGWADGIQDNRMANRVIEQAPGFTLPSALQMLGMLLLYIVLIGPVNFIILRTINRREWAWFTIPALVLIFTVLSYYTGFSLRGTRATLNRLAVIQVWPEQEQAQLDGLIGILSPRRTIYQIEAPAGLTLRPLPQDDGGGVMGGVQVATQIEQASTYAARDVLVDASLIAGFTTSGFITDVPQPDSTVRLTFTPEQAPQLAGRVVNTTGLTLEDAVLLLPGGSRQIGTFLPGQSTEFDHSLTAQQSAPFTLLAADRGGIYTQTNLGLTVAEVMGVHYNDGYSYQRVTSEQQRLLYQRQDFLSTVIQDREFSGGRGDRVYLLGWTRTSPLDVTIEGSTWIPEDTTLYIFELPVTVEAAAGDVTIAPGLSTWATTSQTTGEGHLPYDLSLGGGEQVGFRYVPLPAARLATVDQLAITAWQTSTLPGTVYIWNWAGGEWDTLPLMHRPRLTITDPDAYLGPDNAVQLLAINDNASATDFVTYRQLDVSWQGTFE